jgi:RNA ligase
MYEGIVSRITNLQPIVGADFIVSADVTVGGQKIASVVTSKDTPVDSLGVYFGADIQLSTEYCAANNLLITKDEQGNKIAGSGYLDPDKRRITTQRFKGVKSEGLWMPISTVAGSYNEGDKIGAPIAIRYPKFTAVEKPSKPLTRMQKIKRYLSNLMSVPFSLDFPEHTDTDQYLHNLAEIARIPVGTEFWITEKLHGTSHRYGYVLAPNKLTLWQKLINTIVRKVTQNVPYAETSYQYVHGTRRVVLGSDDNGGYYGSNQFRYDAIGTPLLNKGEIVYGEIVGYVGKMPIMNRHDTSPLKEIKKAFGPEMVYDYGLAPGENKFYVYRITQDDGLGHKDLSFPDMQLRAAELGYDHVPLMAHDIFNGDVEQLTSALEAYAQENGIYSESVLGNHISEGVVIKFATGQTFKFKSYGFKVLEGILKVADMEDMV